MTTKKETVDISAIKSEVKTLKVKRSIDKTNAHDKEIESKQKLVDYFEWGIK